MDILDSTIRVHICGDNESIRQRGVLALKRTLHAGHIAITSGFWKEDSEPDLVLTHWIDSRVDNTAQVNRLVKLLEVYQSYANQTAVSLEVRSPRQATALIIYSGEWREAAAILLKTLNGG